MQSSGVCTWQLNINAAAAGAATMRRVSRSTTASYVVSSRGTNFRSSVEVWISKKIVRQRLVFKLLYVHASKTPQSNQSMSHPLAIFYWAGYPIWMITALIQKPRKTIQDVVLADCVVACPQLYLRCLLICHRHTQIVHLVALCHQGVIHILWGLDGTCPFQLYPMASSECL